MKNIRTLLFIVAIVVIGCRGGDAGSQPVNQPAPEPVAKPEPPPPAPVFEIIKMADGHEMVKVGAGEFERGSDSGEKDERPPRKIFLPEFLIDRFEVSNAEYSKCVEAKKCKKLEDVDGFMSPEQPASGLSWAMAMEYCSFMGERLPTEAEWEKAARGGDKRKFPWGKEDPAPGKATFASKFTTAVSSNPDGLSPYGVYNMAGNVAEWVNDWYADDYYGGSPAKNPGGPTSGELKILRGGSFRSSAEHLRSTYRLFENPEYHLPGYGVRCAK